MSDVISFPGLGLEFPVDRVAFSIGSIDIYWYAILLATGFLMAVLFFEKNARRFGLNDDKALDVIFCAAIAGIAGARLYFVIFKWKELFADNPLEIFNLRGGGLGFYGAVIGGVLGVLLGCKIFKVPFLPFLDLAGGALFIGQGLGRWGNFVNGECFGCNTELPWGMTSQNIIRYIMTHTAEEMGCEMTPYLPVHPTFLYESLWCAAGLILFCLLMKKRRFDGAMFLFYAGWNGMGRAWIEGLRTDSLMLGSFRVSQLLGALMAVAAFGILLYINNKIKNLPPEERKPLWCETEEGKAMAGIINEEAPLSQETEETEEPEAEEETKEEEEDLGNDH